ncbi:UNKNOWN [Stylonychia lemnae]|uniref:Uncharacterized protein n=1 Tax=Stylonychia lemnae TaxID=5949 RepID=A0A078B7T5_STYLE|nr:UNKNOWN [Stylonychia lemnae]|eukprot:CDW89352.1 UNKNOWN [Stylonychia lemnae]
MQTHINNSYIENSQIYKRNNNKDIEDIKQKLERYKDLKKEINHLQSARLKSLLTSQTADETSRKQNQNQNNNNSINNQGMSPHPSVKEFQRSPQFNVQSIHSKNHANSQLNSYASFMPNSQTLPQINQQQSPNASFIGVPQHAELSSKVRKLIGPDEDSRTPIRKPIKNGNYNKQLAMPFENQLSTTRHSPALRDGRIEQILGMEIESPKQFLIKIEDEILQEMKEEDDPLVAMQNLQKKKTFKDKVEYFKHRLDVSLKKKEIVLKCINKFRGIALSMGKFMKMHKDFRNMRMRYKDTQLNEMDKLIELNMKIARSWIIQLNSTILKNMIVKSILSNILNNTVKTQMPDPLVKFFQQLTKLGTFVPPSFYNRFENQHSILDEMGSTTRLNTGQRMIIFGFFLFDKVLLRDLGFQPGDSYTQNQNLQQNGINNNSNHLLLYLLSIPDACKSNEFQNECGQW